ncbi:MAG: hypothetical protein A2057_06085 [Ignavibacteria bacterium GWA2_35_9]|nr:MAG: hypothetical protein A2057_06085 [Ignavibacteria bacterium GWA2_35_9]OGU46175.1 MAG: hypothetical protein A2000_15105 [Ignavibacteria bacterium GWB2_36_8]OGU48496.1 MAG: hypothetical protein A2080_04585 [Ignavibacteria bacterium GWC2_36_12]
MSVDEKNKVLKSIFWDYNTELLPFDKLIEGDINAIDDYEFKLILTRMLERLNWYELMDILGIDLIKRLLTPEIISKLRNNELKERYERIRRILFEEPLPFSGWDPEYRKRIKTTLLSYRWDRT